ncbi:MAG TPA: hypothetical protein VFN95_09220 [Flavitalea sp.]|nr:hypothetical protein [Flavitalea sp.]
MQESPGQDGSRTLHRVSLLVERENVFYLENYNTSFGFEQNDGTVPDRVILHERRILNWNKWTTKTNFEKLGKRGRKRRE